MKILILPMALIFLPIACLFILLKYTEKLNHLSIFTKSVLAVLLMSIGILFSYFAILLSIEGMSENGIQCMTGVVFFIPVGLLVNVIGIPTLLFLKKARKFI